MKGIVTKLCCCAMLVACFVDSSEGMYKQWLGVSYTPSNEEHYFNCYRTDSRDSGRYERVIFGEFARQDGKKLEMVNSDNLMTELYYFQSKISRQAKFWKRLVDEDKTMDPAVVEIFKTCYLNSCEIVRDLSVLANDFKNAGIDGDTSMLDDGSLPPLDEQIEYKGEPDFPKYGLYVTCLGLIENGYYLISTLKEISGLLEKAKAEHLNGILDQMNEKLIVIKRNLRNLLEYPPVEGRLSVKK